MSETIRGFKYDALTEADDRIVEAARSGLYACPCGNGAWVSVQTGEVYRGNGGNERVQWQLQLRGPWVKILKDPENERFIEVLREQLAERDATLSAIAEIVRED